jgi:hypothetical protein
MAVSFIGGGNRSTWKKSPTWGKSLTNFITYCLLYLMHLVWAGLQRNKCIENSRNILCSQFGQYSQFLNSHELRLQIVWTKFSCVLPIVWIFKFFKIIKTNRITMRKSRSEIYERYNNYTLNRHFHKFCYYIDRCELWGFICKINSDISHVKYQFFPAGTTFTQL